MKKVLAMVLALVMLLACTAVSVCSAEEDPVTVTVRMPSFGGIPTETEVGQAWEEMMRSKTGVNINFEFSYIPWGEYSTKQDLSLAAFDFEDIMLLASYTDGDTFLDQDIFLELSAYPEQTTNYLAFVEQVANGMDEILDADGHFYGFRSAEVPRLLQGLGIYNCSTYRYDILQANGIAVPETMSDFVAAAEALKAADSSIYPVAYGSSLCKAFNTEEGIYWNGEAFEYGNINEGWKNFLTFCNDLYTKGLLDPDSVAGYDKDTLTQRMLSGKNVMSMSNWFNYVSEWNQNEEFTGTCINALYPTNENLEYTWQDVVNVNEYTLTSHMAIINIEAENPELLVTLCDLQYDKDVYNLVTWGIEGTTYEYGDDGLIHFVSSIREAENGWTEGDKYGMRASSSYRPGFQLCADTRAYIDFAPTETSWINGELVEVSWEEAFPDLNWPEDNCIPTNVFAPAVTFDADEKEQNSNVTTAVETYVSECTAKFITGNMSIEADWDSYVETIKGMGIDSVLERYNTKVTK